MSAKRKPLSGEEAEIGKQFADLLLANGYADWLQSPAASAALLKWRMAMIKLDQPKAPRSEKRRDWRSEAIRAAIYATKWPDIRNETIDPLINQAFADGTAAELFAALAEGVKIAMAKPELSSFARHVITAMIVAIHIMQSEDRFPAKSEIKERVGNVFASKRWGGFCGKEASTRWTEIFKAAGLADLPK